MVSSSLSSVMSIFEQLTMSMNKTCPISNFTSEKDSVGRGFPSILSVAAVVLFQSNFLQDRLEARLVAHTVVNRINL